MRASGRARRPDSTTPIIPTLPEHELRRIEDQITELAAHIHAANYRLLGLIRRFDAARGWGGPMPWNDWPMPFCPVQAGWSTAGTAARCMCTPTWRPCARMGRGRNRTWSMAETFPRKRQGAWRVIAEWSIGLKRKTWALQAPEAMDVAPTQAEWLSEAGGHYRTIADAGHFLPLEATQEVVDQMLRFCCACR